MFFLPQGRMKRLPYLGWSLLVGVISTGIYALLIGADVVQFAQQADNGQAAAGPDLSPFSAKLIVPTLVFMWINFCLAAKRSRDFSGGINWAVALFGIHIFSNAISGGNPLNPDTFWISALLALPAIVILFKLLFSRPRPADMEDLDVATFGERATSNDFAGAGVAQYATDADLRERAAQLRALDEAKRPAPSAVPVARSNAPAKSGFGKRTAGPIMSR